MPPRTAPRSPAEEARADKVEAREPTARRARVPFGAATSVLDVPVDSLDPAYVYRWFNDDGDRIGRAEQAGYEAVETPPASGRETGAGLGSSRTQLVGKTSEGRAQRAVLMRIPKEWNAEDQQAKQSRVDEVDKAIHAGYRGDAAAAGELTVDKVNITNGARQS